ALIGAIHWVVRRPLLRISFDPNGAAGRHAVRAWDFVFYASFGLVVTSSVRVAGVLLVFSYLVVPATVGALLTGSVRGRLLLGWAAGAGVSAAGLAASYAWDLPTGATVVTTFGALLAVVGLALAGRGLGGAVRTRGASALRSLGAGACALVALAGLLVALFPRMDHVWLDWIEAPLPVVELAFLTPRERETYRESHAAIAQATAELARLRALQQEVLWGARAMPEETTERLRQFVAGRSELTAGDRMVLRTLRTRARDQHALEKRRGRLARLAELLEHHLGDVHRGVEPDEVQERERAHGVATAELHRRVDVLERGEAALVNPDRVEQVRHEQPVHDERRRVLRLDRGLADRADPLGRRRDRRLVGQDRPRHLHELHQRHGVEEVEPEDLAGARGRRGQGRDRSE